MDIEPIPEDMSDIAVVAAAAAALEVDMVIPDMSMVKRLSLCR